jgi:type III secretion system (T3SS) SseB-like protein
LPRVPAPVGAGRFSSVTLDLAFLNMRSIIVFLLGITAILSGCTESMPTRPDTQGTNSVSREDSIEGLVATVRADPAKKPLLAKALMSGNVLVIPDPGKKALTLLYFNQPERSFIPVFSSRGIFDQEAYGTGFEGKAMAIDAKRFVSLLENDDLVILNPGHRPAIEFNAQELKAAAGS